MKKISLAAKRYDKFGMDIVDFITNKQRVRFLGALIFAFVIATICFFIFQIILHTPSYGDNSDLTVRAYIDYLNDLQILSNISGVVGIVTNSAGIPAPGITVLLMLNQTLDPSCVNPTNRAANNYVCYTENLTLSATSDSQGLLAWPAFTPESQQTTRRSLSIACTDPNIQCSAPDLLVSLVSTPITLKQIGTLANRTYQINEPLEVQIQVRDSDGNALPNRRVFAFTRPSTYIASVLNLYPDAVAILNNSIVETDDDGLADFTDLSFTAANFELQTLAFFCESDDSILVLDDQAVRVISDVSDMSANITVFAYGLDDQGNNEVIEGDSFAIEVQFNVSVAGKIVFARLKEDPDDLIYLTDNTIDMVVQNWPPSEYQSLDNQIPTLGITQTRKLLQNAISEPSDSTGYALFPNVTFSLSGKKGRYVVEFFCDGQSIGTAPFSVSTQTWSMTVYDQPPAQVTINQLVNPWATVRLLDYYGSPVVGKDVEVEVGVLFNLSGVQYFFNYPINSKCFPSDVNGVAGCEVTLLYVDSDVEQLYFYFSEDGGTWAISQATQVLQDLITIEKTTCQVIPNANFTLSPVTLTIQDSNDVYLTYNVSFEYTVYDVHYKVIPNYGPFKITTPGFGSSDIQVYCKETTGKTGCYSNGEGIITISTLTISLFSQVLSTGQTVPVQIALIDENGNQTSTSGIQNVNIDCSTVIPDPTFYSSIYFNASSDFALSKLTGSSTMISSNVATQTWEFLVTLTPIPVYNYGAQLQFIDTCADYNQNELTVDMTASDNGSYSTQITFSNGCTGKFVFVYFTYFPVQYSEIFSFTVATPPQSPIAVQLSDATLASFTEASPLEVGINKPFNVSISGVLVDTSNNNQPIANYTVRIIESSGTVILGSSFATSNENGLVTFTALTIDFALAGVYELYITSSDQVIFPNDQSQVLYINVTEYVYMKTITSPSTSAALQTNFQQLPQFQLVIGSLVASDTTYNYTFPSNTIFEMYLVRDTQIAEVATVISDFGQEDNGFVPSVDGVVNCSSLMITGLPGNYNLGARIVQTVGSDSQIVIFDGADQAQTALIFSVSASFTITDAQVITDLNINVTLYGKISANVTALGPNGVPASNVAITATLIPTSQDSNCKIVLALLQANATLLNLLSKLNSSVTSNDSGTLAQLSSAFGTLLWAKAPVTECVGSGVAGATFLAGTDVAYTGSDGVGSFVLSVESAASGYYFVQFSLGSKTAASSFFYVTNQLIGQVSIVSQPVALSVPVSSILAAQNGPSREVTFYNKPAQDALSMKDPQIQIFDVQGQPLPNATQRTFSINVFKQQKGNQFVLDSGSSVQYSGRTSNYITVSPNGLYQLKGLHFTTLSGSNYFKLQFVVQGVASSLSSQFYVHDYSKPDFSALQKNFKLVVIVFMLCSIPLFLGNSIHRNMKVQSAFAAFGFVVSVACVILIFVLLIGPYAAIGIQNEDQYLIFLHALLGIATLAMCVGFIYLIIAKEIAHIAEKEWGTQEARDMIKQNLMPYGDRRFVAKGQMVDKMKSDSKLLQPSEPRKSPGLLTKIKGFFDKIFKKRQDGPSSSSKDKPKKRDAVFRYPQKVFYALLMALILGSMFLALFVMLIQYLQLVLAVANAKLIEIKYTLQTTTSADFADQYNAFLSAAKSNCNIGDALSAATNPSGILNCAGGVSDYIFSGTLDQFMMNFVLQVGTQFLNNFNFAVTLGLYIAIVIAYLAFLGCWIFFFIKFRQDSIALRTGKYPYDLSGVSLTSAYTYVPLHAYKTILGAIIVFVGVFLAVFLFSWSLFRAFVWQKIQSALIALLSAWLAVLIVTTIMQQVSRRIIIQNQIILWPRAFKLFEFILMLLAIGGGPISALIAIIVLGVKMMARFMVVCLPSTTPVQFDPNYAAYAAMLIIHNYYSNPVFKVASQIFIDDYQKRKPFREGSSDVEMNAPDNSILITQKDPTFDAEKISLVRANIHHSDATPIKIPTKTSKAEQFRNKIWLWVLLTRNRELIALRKHKLAERKYMMSQHEEDEDIPNATRA